MQNSAKVSPVDTRQELAKIVGFSHDTIAKIEMIEQKAPEEVKARLRTGDTTHANKRKAVGNTLLRKPPTGTVHLVGGAT